MDRGRYRMVAVGQHHRTAVVRTGARGCHTAAMQTGAKVEKKKKKKIGPTISIHTLRKCTNTFKNSREATELRRVVIQIN